MIYPYKDYMPDVHKKCFIAPTAQIIGRVIVEENANIWFGAILRADINEIRIGARTNIQDGVVVHVSKDVGTTIGKGVTVGHNAIIHGCTIGDYTLIGMGSTILDGAIIGKHCIIGANSLVTKGMVVPEGSLVLGMPARIIKPLTDMQKESLYTSANNYVKLAEEYKQSL